MTVTPSIDPARLLEEQLAQASPDLLRELLGTFINALLSAEADAVCGAAYGTSSPERINQRNGYRHRDFDTRSGTLAVSRHRAGSRSPPPRSAPAPRGCGARGATRGSTTRSAAWGSRHPDEQAGAVPGCHRPVEVAGLGDGQGA